MITPLAGRGDGRRPEFTSARGAADGGCCPYEPFVSPAPRSLRSLRAHSASESLSLRSLNAGRPRAARSYGGDKAKAQEPHDFGAIVLRDVSFSFATKPNALVLAAVTAAFPEGAKVAIVGRRDANSAAALALPHISTRSMCTREEKRGEGKGE